MIPETPIRNDSLARHRLISNTPAEHKISFPHPSEVAFQAVPNMAAQAQPRTNLFFSIFPFTHLFHYFYYCY